MASPPFRPRPRLPDDKGAASADFVLGSAMFRSDDGRTVPEAVVNNLDQKSANS
jgi:hypothetical protein